MLAVVAVLSGCTQNNGRIGHWFGQWKVERLTVDGADDPTYGGDAFFCFQSSVFGVRISYPETGGSAMYYGAWEERDGVLNVKFNTAESSVPGGLHLAEECNFRIVAAGNKEKTLELVGEGGETYTYYLKRW